MKKDQNVTPQGLRVNFYRLKSKVPSTDFEKETFRSVNGYFFGIFQQTQEKPFNSYKKAQKMCDTSRGFYGSYEGYHFRHEIQIILVAGTQTFLNVFKKNLFSTYSGVTKHIKNMFYTLFMSVIIQFTLDFTNFFFVKFFSLFLI